jgi:hypothetical protein
LQGYNSGQRRLKKGGGQAVEYFLFMTVLVNYYLLALYSEWEGKKIPRSQDNFRIQLVELLLTLGKNTEVPKKQVFPYTDSEAIEIFLHQHQYIKIPTRKDYTACKGVKHQDQLLKRAALSEITANLGRKNERRTSIYSCKQYKVALCREGGCFERYHQNKCN